MKQAYRHGVVALSLTFLIAMAASAGPNDPAPVRPSSGPWDAGSGFKFVNKEKKKRQALSGKACPANSSGQRRCLAVFDEGGERAIW